MCNKSGCKAAGVFLNQYFQIHSILDENARNKVIEFIREEVSVAVRRWVRKTKLIEPGVLDEECVGGLVVEILVDKLSVAAGTVQLWHKCRNHTQKGCLVGYFARTVTNWWMDQFPSVTRIVTIQEVRPAGDRTLIVTTAPHGLTGEEDLTIKGSCSTPTVDGIWKTAGLRRKWSDGVGKYLRVDDRTVELWTTIQSGDGGGEIRFPQRPLTMSISGTADQPGIVIPDPGDTQESVTLLSILGISFDELMERLECDQCREILVMRYVEGMTLDEVAKAMSLSTSQIKTIEKRCLETLRLIIQTLRREHERF